MRLPLSILIPAAAWLSGCSPGGLSVTGTKCSGDLGFFLAQCITNRLGNAAALPAIQTEWTHQFRPIEDIILVPGNHFSEIQSCLRQAYGDPDPSLGSSPVHAMAGGQSGTYGTKQIGVVLNFSGDAKQTIICILGRYGHVPPPPNPQGGASGWQPVSSDTNSTSSSAPITQHDRSPQKT